LESQADEELARLLETQTDAKQDEAALSNRVANIELERLTKLAELTAKANAAEDAKPKFLKMADAALALATQPPPVVAYKARTDPLRGVEVWPCEIVASDPKAFRVMEPSPRRGVTQAEWQAAAVAEQAGNRLVDGSPSEPGSRPVVTGNSSKSVRQELSRAQAELRAVTTRIEDAKSSLLEVTTEVSEWRTCADALQLLEEADSRPNCRPPRPEEKSPLESPTLRQYQETSQVVHLKAELERLAGENKALQEEAEATVASCLESQRAYELKLSDCYETRKRCAPPPNYIDKHSGASNPSAMRPPFTSHSREECKHTHVAPPAASRL